MALESLINEIANINPLLAEQMISNSWVLPLLIAQLIMKFIFYPIALYFAGKNKQKAWFVILFIGLIVLNDFGLLAILYLIFNRINIKKNIQGSKSRKSIKKK